MAVLAQPPLAPSQHVVLHLNQSQPVVSHECGRQTLLFYYYIIIILYYYYIIIIGSTDQQDTATTTPDAEHCARFKE